VFSRLPPGFAVQTKGGRKSGVVVSTMPPESCTPHTIPVLLAMMERKTERRGHRFKLLDLGGGLRLRMCEMRGRSVVRAVSITGRTPSEAAAMAYERAVSWH